MDPIKYEISLPQAKNRLDCFQNDNILINEYVKTFTKNVLFNISDKRKIKSKSHFFSNEFIASMFISLID